ncbi:MAG: ABC transporter permease [Chitinophagales bacterium]|nr:ABC transporter permease [Chitinophagales bacterium]
MRTLRFLLIKEFKQIFRNKNLLPMMFLMPIIQLLILPLAADFDIKNINIAIVDHDRSDYAQSLIKKITASDYFKLVAYEINYANAFKLIEQDKADLILEIPTHFEQNLIKEGNQELFLAINSINGVKASIGGSYASAIIKDFNYALATTLYSVNNQNKLSNISVNIINWFNPYLNYQIFMVPGILVILVTMIGAYMCSLNIVKEKEIGTIEQINVTPIKKYIYILGKLIPFWIIGIFVFTLGFFIVGMLVYKITPIGNILLLYIFLAIYLVAMLGFGLLISTYTDTQQQAMSIAFFFMMIFILMSGLYTPINAMPNWAKVIAYSNPVTYFIEVMRMVVLKGSTLKNISTHIYIMIAFAIFFNSWAIINYRKTN